MAELINLPNGRVDLKFHAPVKSFKGVKKLNYDKQYFKLYIDKNNSVYDVKRCEVVSWKTSQNKKVPAEIVETRDIKFFNKVKGNPYKIAKDKIIDELYVMAHY